MTLIRGLAALRPGSMISTTASAKTALRALARRWLALDGEIREHDVTLEALARKRAPALMTAPGISTGTVAEMLVVLGDNPERIRSEAAFAKLNVIHLNTSVGSAISRLRCLSEPWGGG
jgi:transposase